MTEASKNIFMTGVATSKASMPTFNSSPCTRQNDMSDSISDIVISHCLQLPDFQLKSLIRAITRKSDPSSLTGSALGLFTSINDLPKDEMAKIVKKLVEYDHESDRHQAKMKRQNCK